MSSYLIKQFIKGIALRGESTDILDETVEGSLFHNSTQQKIKSYIEGAVREVVTNSQIQTLTNKTIVAANNSIVVASTNTNLSSTELNNALTELQNDIDSNSGNLASHIAAADPHSQYETSVEAQAKVDAHANRTDNPHSVTKAQVGLGNVDNTNDANKPVSIATQSALDAKENLTNKSTDVLLGTSDSLYPTQNAVKNYVDSSISSAATPDATDLIKGKIKLAGDLAGTADVPTVPGLATKEPSITAGTTSQYFRGDKTFQTLDKNAVGLSNVDNTSDANKPVSIATQSALDLKLNSSQVGVANGAASLDATGKVPSSQLPSYVDDVLEFSDLGAFPAGETGKIYVALDTGKCYRFSGSIYVEISPSEVISVAGKTGAVLLTKSDVGLSNVDNTSDLNKPISTATQTALNLKANSADVYTKIESDANFEPKNANIQTHISSTSNPHNVTASQVGLGNVDNTSDLNKPISTATQTALAGKYDVSNPAGYVNAAGAAAAAPVQSVAGKTGPVLLDKSDVGLSNVDNTSDLNKPISTATQTALSGKANTSHTHTSADITDFNESVDDRISSTIVAGTNVTVAYDDNANTLTISAAGGGGGSTTLDGLTDVSVPSPSNGQALVYNTATSQWEAQTISSGGGGSTDLDGLTDVTLASVLDNQILRYDLASTQWKNETLLKDDIGLSNVDNTSDASKPISTATQTALNAKVNKAGDRMTGNLEMGTVGYISYSVQPVSDPSFVIGDVVEIYRNNFPYNTTPVLIGTTTVDGTGVISISNITSVITAYFDANGVPYLLSNSPILNEIRYLTNGYNYPNDIFSFLISVPSRSYGPSFDFTQYDAFQTFFNKIKNLDNGVDTRDAVNKSQLDTKANSIHTHVSADITDFNESVDDRVSSLLVAGSNITLTYDDNANTLSIAAAGSAPSTSSEKLVTNVFNDSGATIPKMSAVYINGSQGDQAKIVLAQANTEATSSKTYGLVQSDILATESGVVVEQGRLGNLNTDIVGWNEGDVLWLSSTIAGGITNVKPSAPNHAVFIGYLIKKHHSVGVIQVSIQNGYEIQELHNVAVTSIADGQVLKYESATSLWKNHTLTKSDVGLSNVDNTSDASKPVSTATQTALDAKVNKAGDTMTGNLKMGAPILVTYAPPTYSGLFPLEVVDIYIAEPNTVLPDVLIGSVSADSSGNILPSQIITVFENYFIANSIVYELPATINPTIIYEQRNTPETAYYLPKISGTIDTINTSVSFAVPSNQIKELANGTSPKDAVNKSQLDTKQDTLVSGTNIKTVNGESLLGLGDIVISGGGSTTLSGLTDVSDSIPTSNQLLVYSSATSEWVPTTVSTGVSSVNSQNGDVVLTAQNVQAYLSTITIVNSTPFVDNGNTNGRLLLVDTSTGAKTINLPVSPADGFSVIVKDYKGNSSASNITIAKSASHTIEQLNSNYVCESNFGSWTFVYDGSNNWVIL